MGLIADLVSTTLALGVGYLAVTTPAGPVASWPSIWRFVGFLAATFFARAVFSGVLGLLVPLLSGPANLAEVIAFLGGIILAVAVLLVYVRLGGSSAKV